MRFQFLGLQRARTEQEQEGWLSNRAVEVAKHVSNPGPLLHNRVSGRDHAHYRGAPEAEPGELGEWVLEERPRQLRRAVAVHRRRAAAPRHPIGLAGTDKGKQGGTPGEEGLLVGRNVCWGVGWGGGVQEQ